VSFDICRVLSGVCCVPFVSTTSEQLSTPGGRAANRNLNQATRSPGSHSEHYTGLSSIFLVVHGVRKTDDCTELVYILYITHT